MVQRRLALLLPIPGPRMNAVTIYYLEMLDAGAVIAAPQPEALSVCEAEIKDYRLNRFLYQYVGEPWQWTDKLDSTDKQWRNWAESDEVRTWVAYCRGSIAGYYELHQQADNNVEIAYFGLAQTFFGRGFGGYLLTHALQSAWAWDNTQRVWLHTCSLDHPNALRNYQSRGLKVFKTEGE